MMTFTPRMERSLFGGRRPGLNRRHFELIASILKDVKPPAPIDIHGGAFTAQWEHTVNEFAAQLRRTNSQFRPEQFKRAAGMED
jgi:hypothetical protein